MATKKVYLVDTENVGSTWKNLLPVKTGSDQILLFFTENSPYVSYSDLQLILQFPNHFEMIKCYPGKNGLDFQLISYLGYLLKTASKSNYVIISNDTGFDAAVKFWQDRGMSISRMNVHRVLQPAVKPKQTVAAKQEAPKEKHKNPAAPATKETTSHGNKILQESNAAVSSKNNAAANGKLENAPSPEPDAKSADTAKTEAKFASANAAETTVFKDSVNTAIDAAAGDIDPPANYAAETEDGSNDEETAKTGDGTYVEDAVKTGDSANIEDAAKTGDSANFEDAAKTGDSANAVVTAKTGEDANVGVEAETRESANVEDAAKTGNSANVEDAAEATGSADVKDSAKTGNSANVEDAAEAADSADIKDAAKTGNNSNVEDAAKTSDSADVKDAAKTGDSANTEDTADIEKPAPKRKRGRPPKSAAQKNTAAPTEGAEQAAEKPAAKRRRKTSDVPSAQTAAPAVSDNDSESENKEPHFSNLIISEKMSLVCKYLPEEFSENPEFPELISDIIFGHDTTDHHHLHIAFVKSFGDETGTRLYKAFRPHLAKFRA